MTATPAQAAERRALIHAVVVVREAEARLRQALNEKRMAFDAANADAITALRQACEDRGDLEGQLRALILSEYEQTGSKKPAPGLGVRVVTKLLYHPSDALRWAREHDLAIKLDVPAFEKIARSTELPFVRTTQEATATISPDLTEEVAS